MTSTASLTSLPAAVAAGSRAAWFEPSRVFGVTVPPGGGVADASVSDWTDGVCITLAPKGDCSHRFDALEVVLDAPTRSGGDDLGWGAIAEQRGATARDADSFAAFKVPQSEYRYCAARRFIGSTSFVAATRAYGRVLRTGRGQANALRLSLTFDEAASTAEFELRPAPADAASDDAAAAEWRLKATLPLDRILVETDAPYLAPVPYRGKPNEPAYVVKTLAALAELRGLPVEEMAKITSDNFFRLFSKVPKLASETAAA